MIDGRRLRREQNRDAVLDALAALFAEGVYQPNAAEIAERAAISPRSVFRYFDDVDDLTRAAIERQLAAARPLVTVAPGPDAPLRERVEQLVASRLRLFDRIEPAARAARVCAHRNPVVAAQLSDARTYLRNQVARLFAPELRGARRALLPAVDALCSFETYELLHVDQRLSRGRTTAAITSALLAMLGEAEHVS